MFESDYQFFLDYHKGKVRLPLTKEQYNEVRASNFAMNLLIPDQALIEYCGGIEMLERIVSKEDGCVFPHVDWLSHAFRVPKEIMEIQMAQVVLNHQLEKGKKAQSQDHGIQKRK